MNKKVLFISYDGLSDPLGQSQIIPYLSGLADKGYDITILSCEKEKKILAEEKQIMKYLTAKKIEWHYVFFFTNPPLLSSLYNIFLLKRKATLLHKRKDFSLIHCRSYISALIGLGMKKQFNTKFIFDMRGFWVDERVEGKLWNLKNPIYKFLYDYFKRKENQFIENADYTIALTEKAKEIIHSWKTISGQPVPIQVIPCCVDMDHFSRDQVNDQELTLLKKDLGIGTSDFILSYLGSLGTWYCLDEMLAFFSRLSHTMHNAKFLFITQDDPQAIHSAAKKYCIPKEKLIIHAVPYSKVPVNLALSSFSIFFITPTFSKKASSPTKMGEVMAMGIPLICNSDIGDVEQIINKTNAGIIIPQFSENAYDTAIKQLGVLPNKDKIRKYAQLFFSIEDGVRRYEKIYQLLI